MEVFVRLDKGTYTANAGWPLPAATLPGAKVRRLLIDGKPEDIENNWKLEGGHFRKTSGSPPASDGDALIELTQKLLPIWVPVIASVSAALIGAVATLATRPTPTPSRITPEQAQLCREALSTLNVPGSDRRSVESMQSLANIAYDRCFTLVVTAETGR